MCGLLRGYGGRGYGPCYPYELSIRSRLPSDAETELAKRVNGSGDRMFCGHANEDGRGLAA
jgi:hypothetical protein